MSKELEKKEPTEVVEAGLFEGDMDTGFESTYADTFKTPFMKILQALSPELDESSPQYIPDAKQGMFCNSATLELLKELNVVVLKVEHCLLVWKPNRGGFVGRVSKLEEDQVVTVREGSKKWDKDGNSVDDTIEFYCVNPSDHTDIFILSLSKTQVKYGKAFATRMRLLKANGKPVGVTWAGVWNLKTVKESNDQGSWYTIGASPNFIRFINAEEKATAIVPSKKKLLTAETDYSQMESGDKGGSGEEDTEY
jgi:hypothetical protein